MTDDTAADRWPSATRWVVCDDDGIRIWESTQDHRERREYRP